MKLFSVVLDALFDTLKIVPILLLVYFLIEFLEYKQVMKLQSSKLLKGKTSPLFGSLFGSLPQCGFSVVSTDLYTKGIVSIGALLGVYIATSDEALPIMLSHPNNWLALVMLIVCKIVLGVGVGYLAMWLYSKIFKVNNIHCVDNKFVKANVDYADAVEEVDNEEHGHHEEFAHDEHVHDEEHEEVKVGEHIGCCHHDLESSKFDWVHPLLHCLKIAGFILIVNLIFGLLIMWIGEDQLVDFLSKSEILQPLLAVIIGLIPNCASSVVITELYLLGGLSFGSILAGLAVNAGLGWMVLFKQDKNWKEIAFIISMLVIPSLIVGYALHLII